MEVEQLRGTEYSSMHGPKQGYFSPYSFNGGSVLAVAGDDFSVIASDSRLSEGFSIHTRDQPKTYQLTPTTVVGSCGFHGDVLTLIKVLKSRIKMYHHEHNKNMTTTATAAMLATILYYRRFFPYYVYNIVAGIDDEGKGCVFSFDPVGSYEREPYRAGGSASSMLQPLMDNQVGFKNQPAENRTKLTKEQVIKIVRDGFISAAERDIYTGDEVVINVVTKDGVEVIKFPLRRD
ncbi:proteasome subunit beta type-1-like [Mya arenaria]|uniref:proteasome subunit beta type-1-like n=1 Tax=Mya arenaria TaxID=6604 RepID=UPI0022E3C4A6|nr:proteasome subunit beta type-1-like [Mya arenaria]